MNHSDPSPHPLPKTKWKILGELKLEAGSNPNGTIKAWLVNIIDDLSLPGEFVSRILSSIEEAALRVLSLDDVEGQSEHLDIVVFTSAVQESKGHTWGFFRVEKMSSDSKHESAIGHCVEYYLYLDKKMGKDVKNLE